MKISRLALSVSMFALVSASVAFATPKVGDSTTMNGTLVGQGINAKVSTTQSITAFDANAGVYTVNQSQTVAGQTQSKDVQVAVDDMMTEETAAAIVAACESQKIGTKERIKVAAGTFDTCKVVSDNGSLLWIAQIPFGVARLQTAIDVGTVNIDATTFARGH